MVEALQVLCWAAQVEDLFLLVSISLYVGGDVRLEICPSIDLFSSITISCKESFPVFLFLAARLSMEKGTPLPACSEVGVYQQSSK